MEQFFYLIVKIFAVYLLLKTLFIYLFGKNGKKRWIFLNPKKPNSNNTKPLLDEPEYQTTHSIVGKSRTRYLKEPPLEKHLVPFLSEDLEILLNKKNEEPDIKDEDVEYIPKDETQQDIIEEMERFSSDNESPDTEGHSTGLTYEEIACAYDVVTGKETDDSRHQKAARLLYEIHGSDVFDFLSAQAENEMMIEKLIKAHVDGDGVITKDKSNRQKKSVENFDMSKYV
jgi:hypothetical protein